MAEKIGKSENATSVQASSSSQGPQSASRPVRLYRPSNRPFDARALANSIPESFYEPTGNDIQAAYNSLHSRTRALEDAPLLTRKLRDEEEQKRMSRFPRVIIRFLFPDRHTLEGVFAPGDRVSELYNFLKASLKDDGRNVKFALFVTPPKKVLRDKNKTLWKEGLAPAALVHVGVDIGAKDTRNLVRADIWNKVEDAPAPKQVGVTMAEADRKLRQGKGSSSGDKVKSAVESGKKAAGKVMPKWLIKNLKRR